MSSGEPSDPGRKPLESRYANYFEISFNTHEIVIDCGQYYAGDREPKIYARIITSPPYAQSLMCRSPDLI